MGLWKHLKMALLVLLFGDVIFLIHSPLFKETSMMILSLGLVVFKENVGLSESNELFSLVMHIVALNEWQRWDDK